MGKLASHNLPVHSLERSPALPDELFAPLEWRDEELEQLRQRVRELMRTGLRRSEASQVAFAELVARRAIARAQAEAAAPIGTGAPLESPEPVA